MPLREGTILDNRYRIEKLLAQGGMGSVYRAFDDNLNTPVAIKENFFQTPEAIQQFQEEARILARLRHPALPRVSHYFSVAGTQYLVMDFIEGDDLWEMVRHRGRPLSEPEALEYIIQVCEAVAYLHRQKPPIIHRDIKPQNIKITSDKQVMLVDFGIAKVAEQDGRTRTGAQAITPGFSPPEQYSGVGTTPRSDIYALGATLYAVLTGKKPQDSIVLMINPESYTPPHIHNSALSKGVSQAIYQAMQSKPENRPASVLLWQQTLKETLSPPSVEEKVTEETFPSGFPGQTGGGPAYWLVNAVTGQAQKLGPGQFVIGRHSNADLVVDDRLVSRRHALLRIKGKYCQVMDNNSSNGTLLNGEMITGRWHLFNPDDVLTIGSTEFKLVMEDPALAGTPALKPPRLATLDEVKTDIHTVPQQPVNLRPPASAPSSHPTWLILLMALLILGGIAVVAFVLLAQT